MKPPKAGDEPVVRPGGGNPAAKGNIKGAAKPRPKPTGDPYSFWDSYYSQAKEEDPEEMFRTVRDLIADKKYDHAEAAIKGYLHYHGKDVQPWMYELLVKCVEMRNHTADEVGKILGFAAHVAKKSKIPIDLIRVADMMLIRDLVGTVGDPGYQSSVAELLDLAAEKAPADVRPPYMSIKLASKIRDPKRMAESAERVLSLGWLQFDEKIRADVKEQVKLLADALKVEGRTDEAEALMAKLAESEARDVYVRLTWKGEADIDIAVAEPFGGSAKYETPRTVFGGAIVLNGYGKHPEEVYTCPRGFDGEYAVAVQKIVDYDEKRPVTEATLEIILHEGSPDEKREVRTIDLAKGKPSPVVVKLTGGRRKAVLPFIAPPEPPKAPTRPNAPKPTPLR